MVDVVQAVINSINKKYPNIKINDVSREQGVKTPCFLVYMVTETLEPYLNDRCYYNATVSVVYLSDKKSRENINGVGRGLLGLLRNITVLDKAVEGSDINTVQKDGTDLVAMATYNLRLNAEQEKILMNRLDIEKRSKND